ncbi:MAG: PEP-CTERM sorting domain-containing protein [Pedobacter sp.]|nr:MAG: PEP-CTERM sorting domain-containing protein [Pedobacter sp.]
MALAWVPEPSTILLLI